jgi:hypothetical protein
MVDHGPDCLAFRAVIHLDAHLAKPHERPQAYSTDDQGICTILLEQEHGGVARALPVGKVLYDGHVSNLTVVNVDQREEVAMPEVT